MALYSALSPLIEANQWRRNGDHPDDRTINRINTGLVVKRHPYYKTPRGESLCNFCEKPLHVHGDLAGNTVCPGDYIITHYKPDGKKRGYSLMKQADFESRYELYKGPIPQ